MICGGNNIPHLRRELADYIREGGYQLIHCHGSRANMIGALLRKSTGLPVVSTVHSDYKLDYMGRPFARLTFGAINAWALRHLDYRIGVSDAMVDLLIDRGFPPDRFYAIYNGIDFTPAPSQGERLAYLRGLGADVEENSVVVGIAARLNPVKDMSTLIRGFAEGHKSCPRLRLVIAGDGEERQKLGDLAKELGVEKDEAVYVGDSDVDVATAAHAGLPCISVLWGFRDRDFLERNGAVRFADRPADILGLLESISRL